ncbi:MAG: sodium:proton exchanger [Actinobacteria bacterium]|nr:sodium:proton exchanger [Actinomycetota bacterium]
MSRRRVDPQPPSEKVSRSENRGQRGRRAAKAGAVATITVDRPHGLAVLSHSDRRLLAIVVGVSIAAGILHNTNGNPVLSFLAATVALGAIARLVVRSVEAISDRIGQGLNGTLQSLLGNLPEIFVILFALKAGLYEIVKATIVGSVIANILLVMGIAFVVSGRKFGRQAFNVVSARQLSMLLALSVFALAIPSLAASFNTPAVEHERQITVIISLLLIVLFLASIPDTIRHVDHESPITGSNEALVAAAEADEHGQWPFNIAALMVLVAITGSIVVSSWFVDVLPTAMSTLGISEAFAGLIIVALASNVVEGFSGIQLAARGQQSYALQIILQSPVQVAMIIAPLIALAAPLVGAATFTLVLSPLLLAVMFMAVFIAIVVVSDGQSTWFEGAALITLYLGIATAFWWS